MSNTRFLRQPTFILGALLRCAILAWILAGQLSDILPPMVVGGGWAAQLAQSLLLTLAGQIGVALLALILDVCVGVLLRRQAGSERAHEVASLYWLSPLAWLAILFPSRLDGIGTALVIGSFLQLKRGRYASAAGLLGAASAAQPIVALLTPFFALYLLGTHRLRSIATLPLLILLLTTIAALLPIFWLPSAAVDLTSGLLTSMPSSGPAAVLLAPIAYGGLLYTAWRIRRLDTDLYWVFCSLCLLLVFLFAVPAPGSVMLAPFLVTHAAYAQASGRVVLGLFTAVYAAILFWATWTIFPSGLPAPPWINETAVDFLLTAMVASGLVIGAQIVTRGISRSAYFLALRRPFTIGISGDSGAGKDTLVDSIRSIFGAGAVAHISGDDYHLWDRNKPMWRAVTHLSPKANDLQGFASDVARLIDRRSVRVRHYDHKTGRMTKPMTIEHADVVAVSGLHALWSPDLNGLYDLRIYLGMDEPLRRYLKIRRDVTVRGHPLARVMGSIERRWIDSQRFIHPQAEAADLVMKLEARHPSALTKDVHSDQIPLRLNIVAKPGHDFGELARMLTSLCGMQVVEIPLEKGYTELLIEGDATPEDIAAAARRLTSGLTQLISLTPTWDAGLRGVMQLVVLDQLEHIWRRRSLNA